MTSAPKTVRPIRLIFLIFLVLAVAGSNGLRLGETIFFWKTLEEYHANPLYIALSGGVWFIVGLFLALGLWLGKKWGWLVAISGTTGYISWYWVDRLIYQEHHSNWLFSLIVSFICLVMIISILFSQKTRLFFMRDIYGRKPETPTPS
jgi:hypothetical protein